MNQGKSALRARSFSAASWQIPETCSIFFHGREPQLTFVAFAFRWNAQRKHLHKFALVCVNAKYIALLKLTMNPDKGALCAVSFSAAPWQISGTCSIFFHGREPQLFFGAFGFRWNTQIKNLHKFALVQVNAKYIAPLKLTMNLGKGAFRARSFSAASWQISGTCSIFFHGREPQLTLTFKRVD